MSIDLAKCFLEYTEIAEAMTLAKLQVFPSAGARSTLYLDHLQSAPPIHSALWAWSRDGHLANILMDNRNSAFGLILSTVSTEQRTSNSMF